MKPQVIICSRVERKNINSAGDFEVLDTESAVLIHELKETRAGKSSLQRLDIIADVVVDKAVELQRIPQLWRLTDSNGKLFLWGNADYKSKCKSCTRVGDNTRISFNRETPNLDI